MLKGLLLLCSVGWQSVTGMDLHNGISYCEFYETVESFQTKEECMEGLDIASEEYIEQSEKGSAVFTWCIEGDKNG